MLFLWVVGVSASRENDATGESPPLVRWAMGPLVRHVAAMSRRDQAASASKTKIAQQRAHCGSCAGGGGMRYVENIGIRPSYHLLGEQVGWPRSTVHRADVGPSQ